MTIPAGLPSAVSLFTGAGGLDIGLERAGFHVVVATDFDEDCMDTLRASRDAAIPIPGQEGRRYLDRSRLVLRPIEDLRPADLRLQGATRNWRPDLLVGGPPCQPFSSAGKMLSLSDPRGRLFEHFVRLAKGLRPRLILFENVGGLVTARGPSGEPGEAIALVKEAFEAIGYATNFSLLNAADFGAPQRRVRCFMLASRLEPLPEFPAPTHAEESQTSLFDERLPWVSLGEFLRGRAEPSEFEVERPGRELARKLSELPNGSGLKSRGIREATRPGGHWGYKQGTWIADLEKPARTVTAATTQDWVRDSRGRLRRLTWEECAALQGFPKEWRFLGSKPSRFRQIGNAVPTVFGEVLGHALLQALRSERRRLARSAPFPARFTSAIAYTRREHERNGASREAGKLRVRAGADVGLVKGLGSDEYRDQEERLLSANSSSS